MNIVKPSNDNKNVNINDDKNNDNDKNNDDGIEWPNASLFGIYDGHGGNKCADFLWDNLHHYLVRTESYPEEPLWALQETILHCEK